MGYEDERVEQLTDEIDAADYTILNENEATRLPTNGRSTSRDISLASNDIDSLSRPLCAVLNVRRQLGLLLL